MTEDAEPRSADSTSGPAAAGRPTTGSHPETAGGPAAASQPETVAGTDAHPRAEDLLRARVLTAGMLTAPRPARARLTPAILVASLLLAISAGASLTFVLARGGISLTDAPASRGPVAAASAAAPEPSSMGAPSTSSPAPPATSIPTPGATALPSAVQSPSPTAAPSPTSDRYAVLVACPGTAGCWIYTVRQGDNLVSIANWFGVALSTIYEMNPGLRTTTLRAGMQIRIPTPTR